AWHTLTAALPGSYYLYQGEELELPEATQLPPESREDPTFARTGGEELGRDGCRVPIPWRADAPAFGFSPDGESWLPQPADWGRFAVDTQEADPESALAYYTKLLHLRARYDLGLGGLRRAPEYAGSGVALINFAGDAAASSRGDLLVMTAFAEPLPLPEGWAVLLSSAPLEEEGVLPPDTTVYLVPFSTDTEEGC
ncbi:alpha-amylase family glycosyl hydrolase, partial [Actinotignum sanguinis]|nr:amylase [Actinotignum sanguinis]